MELAAMSKDSLLDRANDLRAQIADAEVELEGAEDNEEVYRWTSHLDELRQEETEINTMLDDTTEDNAGKPSKRDGRQAHIEAVKSTF